MEVVCEALGAIHAALKEVYEVDLPGDEEQGALICQMAKQLRPYMDRLANLDMPVANALADIQNVIENIGSYLQAHDEWVLEEEGCC